MKEIKLVISELDDDIRKISDLFLEHLERIEAALEEHKAYIEDTRSPFHPLLARRCAQVRTTCGEAQSLIYRTEEDWDSAKRSILQKIDARKFFLDEEDETLIDRSLLDIGSIGKLARALNEQVVLLGVTREKCEVTKAPGDGTGFPDGGEWCGDWEP